MTVDITIEITEDVVSIWLPDGSQFEFTGTTQDQAAEFIAMINQINKD